MTQRCTRTFARSIGTIAAALLIGAGGPARAGMTAAKRWVNEAFQPSTLSKKEQMAELRWFAKTAEPFRGMTIRVVSENIATHRYEASTLAKAFHEITGIKVIHEITAENDVVKKLQTQMKMGIPLYDAYINDSDFIGTHFRMEETVSLTEFMKNAGQDVTLPTLDLDDFIGLSFTRGPDGDLYQLPDQQFANLYWYRHDWFQRPDLQKRFKDRYGYDLGVPQNWAAYEDIAEFFTDHVDKINGKKVYGHMDYGHKGPSIGWRFSDAWLSMAGVGSKGLPNGRPVDDWGIRVDACHPVGASVARGGAANSPAAAYALRKYKKWLTQYAPPRARQMNFSEAGGVPAQGRIAQQIFWYTAFTADMTDPDTPVVQPDGTPKWRMAPSPHGPYWEKGMKLGYQDAGSWTLLKSTPMKRRKAAWLYAQFTVSKTVSLRKTLEGLTPIRKSDIQSNAFGNRSEELGGLVEFYRSQARKLWTPTGTNVPHYAALSPTWWRTLPDVLQEGTSARDAVDALARRMDERLKRLQETSGMRCAPKLNPRRSRSYWLKKPGAPKPRRANEDPRGQTSSLKAARQAYGQ